MTDSSPAIHERKAISLPLDGGGCGWGWTFEHLSPSPQSSPARDCVAIGETGKNVMLNLFQHLTKSRSYETLKRVQGDK